MKLSSQQTDPGPFRAFEHAGWEGVGGRYHDAFGSLTTQAVSPLLDAVGAGEGVRLLGVATG
ncbi:SAM-dependent methyltransferase, partial [bacterium]|nr:SAM-dependent methyltransferase [bacterium]